MSAEKMERSAIISPCGQYRYYLWRCWGDQTRPLTFIMLNPSTADGQVDDPTIRKCIGFAKRMGFGAIAAMNLFAFRATKPEDLWDLGNAGHDIVGADNDHWIRKETRDPNAPIVAAWGRHASSRIADRVDNVLSHIGWSVQCLLENADGSPAHPLMLSYSHKPKPWFPAAEPHHKKEGK